MIGDAKKVLVFCNNIDTVHRYEIGAIFHSQCVSVHAVDDARVPAGVASRGIFFEVDAKSAKRNDAGVSER